MWHDESCAYRCDGAANVSEEPPSRQRQRPRIGCGPATTADPSRFFDDTYSRMLAQVEITAPTTLEFQIAVAPAGAVDGHGDGHASRCAGSSADSAPGIRLCCDGSAPFTYAVKSVAGTDLRQSPAMPSGTAVPSGGLL